MLTFVLPGYSVKNKDWALETSKNLEIGQDVRPVLWEHWDNSDMPFNPKDKANELTEVAMDDSLNIVAKSIGTLVASYIIQSMPSKIGKIILCGIPINDLTKDDLEAERKALMLIPPENIICFQNKSDPHGSFEQAKDFLNQVNPNIKIIAKLRSDHEYPYYSEFQGFLKS